MNHRIARWAVYSLCLLLDVSVAASLYRGYLSGWILLPVAVGLSVLTLYDRLQEKHALLRNYPLLGRARYLLEQIRPEMRQYFFESDTDGRPFNRRQRAVVYQRAKDVKQTVAFGALDNMYEPGYEWAAHTAFPTKVKSEALRVDIGNEQCSQPYNASVLNISAMSYGALSKTAILSLNGGAQIGGFAHNTGEGGISPYHLENGGDLIWQIGTGYFGCRDEAGNFSATVFAEAAAKPAVKMIELKLSQGAKPGKGGVLPGAKNTPEIAAIRKVKPGVSVLSPAAHTAFSNEYEMLAFLQQLRNLSGGKPVGFKLCVGRAEEFERICIAMENTGIYPDFITVDGAEGGTGAAPLEFTDSIGMPLYDALAFVNNTLKAHKLKEHVRILASGKIITGFDIMRVLALGADACYSARGMMLALGCIQALQCDSGNCPVGVATQDPALYQGVNVADKRVRVANFHRNTIYALSELMGACGFAAADKISPAALYRRVTRTDVRSFAEIYAPDDRRAAGASLYPGQSINN
ncbi:FMN-binding glutamate synthase family protein [Chitinophaga nivalis]|uniref:FMN-binding glutamate synthase family protein n=1 Tax=Chitinophaga nivalis TaxID=2991709 RepID=A0ABT3INR1_9BACT|nr:FMN-binding glutamate synthase family protein [Chitinophaga nivalis]MCW3464698.1 FMN-binding glutamate synthase family protein [Chitinophaga nivalis]MCW3485611.1 FMN-binding glutamate synthase family protein [Chitinophaga nivalis]